MNERGELAIVLHSHMPYVEGFGTWPFGEEWLWDALAGVYIPMLDALREAPVTLGLTPVLCDQFEALRGDAGTRFLEFMEGMRADIHTEDAAGLERGDEYELAAEVRRAAGDFSTAAQRFRGMGGDLLGEIERLARTGPLELWTGAATHAVLPMLASDAGRSVELDRGVRGRDYRSSLWSRR